MLRGNIRVVCRARPGAEQSVLAFPAPGAITVYPPGQGHQGVRVQRLLWPRVISGRAASSGGANSQRCACLCAVAHITSFRNPGHASRMVLCVAKGSSLPLL